MNNLTIKQILIKYWGYSNFRPLQEEIINSVLEGKDTLALLPTGGGKSICFQVPALAKEGICIVVTPLIALMKDQVENLQKKQINAVAIYSGMSANEIDIVLDNCIYGGVKFLYLSPERLETDIFKARLSKMNVNMLAVDEAHCISQWGYDFRPPYLRIAHIRELIPDVPVLALTATATPVVVEDIQERLLFKQKNVFQKSFERKNLVYYVIKEEDKFNRMLRIANKIKGTGIVYVRNRRKTKEIAEFFLQNKVSADYYHAGLDTFTRDKKQREWLSGKTRIIVATNAFGMGIDKPDVRFVIHIDITDSIESYFQEAGRGGRDENKAYGFYLYNNADIIEAERSLEQAFPPLDTIKNIYNALGNYFNLAVGSGSDATFDFDIKDFSERFQLQPLIVFNTLKFLEREGYLVATEALYNPSRIHFILHRDQLYEFQIKNKFYDAFIKLILRSYGGVFSNFVKIDESLIAKRANIIVQDVIKHLTELEKFGVLKYVKQTKMPQIIYLRERMDLRNLSISDEVYAQRKEAAHKRMMAIINYLTSENKCRSQILLSYFGENNANRCGNCDICLSRNRVELNKYEFDTVIQQIKPVLQTKAMSLESLVADIKTIPEDKILKVLRWLIDNNKVVYNKSNELEWKKKSKDKGS